MGYSDHPFVALSLYFTWSFGIASASEIFVCILLEATEVALML